MKTKSIICAGVLLFMFCAGICSAEDRDVKVIDLNYYEADSLVDVLNSMKSPDGEVAAIAGSNTIMLNDHPDRLRQMEKVIRQLDVKKKQVGITTTIVEVADNLLRAGALSFSSTIVPREQLDNFLYLIDQDDASSIRSQSSVTTISGQPAVLRVGDEIMAGGYLTRERHHDIYYEPYEIEAGIILEVLPRVSKENNITLSISPEMSEFKSSMTKYERSISTQINLDNGDTLVLGGADISKDQWRQVGIPLINVTIPAKYKNRKKNLVFFLTVKVIE